MVYRAEYIWIDGTEPIPLMRSKTKILDDGEQPGIWGFDGSSTNQAPGNNSDCVLKPGFVCPDPIRKGPNVLVLCEVLLPDTFEPHTTNTRAACTAVADKYKAHESLFGIEQEYTFFKEGRPLGFPANGYPAPQGPYYCGVGADEVFGRDIVEAHTTACIEAGLAISGTNAEVMPGQWEFQIGPVGPVEVSDHLWMGRYLLYRVAEDFGVNASIIAKPMRGDWNGAGAHTNFSTKAMRAVGMRSSTPARHWVHRASRWSTSRATASAPKTASPATTRPPTGPSSSTACPTAVRRSASRGRSRRTRRATSKIVAPTPTWIPTS